MISKLFSYSKHLKNYAFERYSRTVLGCEICYFGGCVFFLTGEYDKQWVRLTRIKFFKLLFPVDLNS